ncbi:MAG: hypothetical protein HC848_09430 [Limnobacter sp.]|nr:hypothetical protein [Limnobacter sp.]
MTSPLQIQPFFRYVQEVDSLRAVAVLAVVANHIGGVSGGYIGVDVFL